MDLRARRRSPSRLASFSRLILHDRRGVGLSGGGGMISNLETQATDLLTVLDACRSARPALLGSTIGAAALAMFAATFPDRVTSLIWFGPMAKTRWSPDYPWGSTPREEREFIARAREHWGGLEFARWYLEHSVPTRASDHALALEEARMDSRTSRGSLDGHTVRSGVERDRCDQRPRRTAVPDAAHRS